MKRNINKRPLASLFGIIAIAAVIGLGLTGCPVEEEGQDWSSNISAITLTLNEWANGQVAQGGEEWFKFTATAGTQYIHVYLGSQDLHVQLHDSAGNAVGSSTTFYWSNSKSQYVSLSVTSGSVYYLRVYPYSYSVTYKIAFTESVVTPDTIAGMASAPELTINTWRQDDIPADGERWFKFTATTASQYIHVYFGTVTDLDVQLHDSSGNAVGVNTYFGGVSNSNGGYTTLSVTSGVVYYLKVWHRYGYTYDGTTYKIAFNTSTTPPADQDS